MNSEPIKRPFWVYHEENLSDSNMVRFRDQINTRHHLNIDNYQDLHAWSVENTGEFWTEIWEFCGVEGEMGSRSFEPKDSMLRASFFPDARLNFAENLLKHSRVSAGGDAMVFWGEDRVKSTISWRDLYSEVSRMAQALKESGVVAGDRVAAYMPNIPETVVAMLATASIGAIWSSCSPDFGIQGVLDRFGQIEPKILITADGYFYSGKEINNLDKIEKIAAQLPSLLRVVIVPYYANTLSTEPSNIGLDNAIIYHDFLLPYIGREIEFAQLAFDHPLYILFSSGTTGVPKCIVHGAGGTLLQHLKEHQLHNDVRPGDRVFYFTTCTWMMWNWLASGLKSVRIMNSTGSPLLAENFDYVRDFIKDDLYLASISGGTDIISCFVLGDPSSDLFRGEIACCGLGMAMEIWDEEGDAIRQEKGELVCVKAFPSMPIYFWNDEGDAKYHAAYFERYGDVWAQGDFAEITENNGFLIHGRSDATLNPGGVRIGTAEIYRQVEGIDGIQEAVVIGQNWSGDVRIVLFVVMSKGLTLDDDLRSRLKARIRSGASPRHVPAIILQVDDIPRTKSGKISELAVRDVVEGRTIKNTSALANPGALQLYRNMIELE